MVKAFEPLRTLNYDYSSDIRETLLSAWTDRSGFFFYFSVLLFLLFVMCVRFELGAIWTLADWLPEESPEESQK